MRETGREGAIDRLAIAGLERFEGKFIVPGSGDMLTAGDTVSGYMQQRLEEAWCAMKDGARSAKL